MTAVAWEQAETPTTLVPRPAPPRLVAAVLQVVAADGTLVGFDMCFAPDCMRHVTLCACEDGPTPPRLGG